MARTPRTYTVTWRRHGERKNFTCCGLTARVAFARLLNALRHSSSIRVVAITPDTAA